MACPAPHPHLLECPCIDCHCTIWGLLNFNCLVCSICQHSIMNIRRHQVLSALLFSVFYQFSVMASLSLMSCSLILFNNLLDGIFIELFLTIQINSIIVSYNMFVNIDLFHKSLLTCPSPLSISQVRCGYYLNRLQYRWWKTNLSSAFVKGENSGTKCAWI